MPATAYFGTDPAWAYGLPELDALRIEQKIRSSKAYMPIRGVTRQAFLLGGIFPLIQAGIVGKDFPVTPAFSSINGLQRRRQEDDCRLWRSP